jgi:hypothetical protein
VCGDDSSRNHECREFLETTVRNDSRQKSESRLVATLLKLGDQSNEVHPGGIEIRATNDQLGALADMSEFTASRVLTSGCAKEFSPRDVADSFNTLPNRL